MVRIPFFCLSLLIFFPLLFSSAGFAQTNQTATGNAGTNAPASEVTQKADAPAPNEKADVETQEEEEMAEPADEKSPAEVQDPAQLEPDSDETTDADNAAEPDNEPADAGDQADNEDKTGANAEPATADATSSNTTATASAQGPFAAFLSSLQLEKREKQIEKVMLPVSKYIFGSIFAGPSVLDSKGEPISDKEGNSISLPLVVLWLLGAAVILTLTFLFINLWGIPLALSTAFGKYSSAGDPGEITHFQALTSAVSGTVGLGNIAGVAVAIAVGGPGAVFWMVLVGFLGMTTKFCECTLGVKYRRVDAQGKVYGGPMYYLAEGFKQRDMAGLGKVLAIGFAIACSCAALGGGNMFQVNQALEQVVRVSGGEASFFAVEGNSLIFGGIVLLIVGSVIIFGIKGIGRVTSILVPVMCITYIIAAIVVILMHADQLGAAFQAIWDGAFTLKAGVGALIIAIIQGVRRAAFSNEAGFGSAPIAHAAVRTKYPASEGLVSLLEPLLDTIIVCTMTGLVIIVTGVYKDPNLAGGIQMTSAAFEQGIPWFRYVLAGAAIVFALSTLITWSYYGQQAFSYLFGRNVVSAGVFKLIFLFFILVGAVIKLDAVLDFSDGMLFLMCIFNLIGVYALLPDVRRELKHYIAYTKAFRQHGGVPPSASYGRPSS